MLKKRKSYEQTGVGGLYFRGEEQLWKKGSCGWQGNTGKAFAIPKDLPSPTAPKDSFVGGKKKSDTKREKDQGLGGDRVLSWGG